MQCTKCAFAGRACSSWNSRTRDNAARQGHEWTLSGRCVGKARGRGLPWAAPEAWLAPWVPCRQTIYHLQRLPITDRF